MDKRTALEKKAWELIGPPLYYCSECLKGVKVTPIEGKEPEIKRSCDCNAQIIAPRKAIAAGVGGLNWKNKAKLKTMQLGAAITGRCV